jgi:hypothetical protein
MTTAPQRTFNFARPTVHAPLIPLSSFSQIRGQSQDAILECVEVDRAVLAREGRETEHLAWAFNIATRGAVQREIRILSHLLTQQHREVLRGEDRELGFVLNLIFPPARHRGRNSALGPNQFVLGTEFQYAVSCREQHVARLIEDGELQTVCEREVKSGPNASPQISWQSISTYFRSHRWPHMERNTL